ncbi:MAG: CaiB/BaiF CoA-transferase family protein, partial [Gammaproteobacteria bacterium]|nr:CaiB/BaiF CoA-transferase family protein [Gammaproteobacteria bacterium]
TGQGRRIDITMIEAITSFAAEPISQFLATGSVPTPYKRATISQSYAFECADGKMLAVHLSSPEKFWTGLLTAVDRTDLATDPRFSKREGRVENFFELREELARVFSTQHRAYWIDRLDENDVPVAPVYDLNEVVADPQVRHMTLFTDVEHATMGTNKALKPPFRLDGNPLERMSPPPMLGEHTASILDELGYAPGEVEGLRNSGVV